VDPLVFALVAGAAVLHVWWNVLLKTAGDPLRAAAIGLTAGSAVIIPIALVLWVVLGPAPLSPEVVGLAIVSGFFESVYFGFLAAAYRRGDLSVIYPLARGSAPLLAVLAGVVILGERLGAAGFVGVALLLVGLLWLQRPWRFLRAHTRDGGAAAAFALATGVAIASYSAVDRVAVRQTEPWLYAALIWPVGVVFLWTWILARDRRSRSGPVSSAGAIDLLDGAGPAVTSVPATHLPTAALGGVMTLAAYLLILVAFTIAPLTAVAPLRESAIVLASGWGAIRLREATGRPEAARRIAASVVVLLGALLLAADG
jgi:drug/metabolite transporter (DMT)-like permease